jgi:hypothetical protein
MTRHESEVAFWSAAESTGVKTILQHVIDEMPAARLAKLLLWVQGQQRQAQRTANGSLSAEEDAVQMMIALGEPRERVMKWLDAVKDRGATSADALVRLLLVERNRR